MADGRAMQEILKNHGLEHLSQRFQLEKISPDIFCQLTSHEMVQNRSNMINFRLCCSKYSTSQPIKVITNGGVQEFNIPKSLLENMLEIGFQISEISKTLSVSERTIYRRMRYKV